MTLSQLRDLEQKATPGVPNPVFDVLYPFAGPCAFCGGPDKRHRLADSIVDCVLAGDDVDFVADNFDVTPAAVRALVKVVRTNRRQHRKRWSPIRSATEKSESR